VPNRPDYIPPLRDSPLKGLTGVGISRHRGKMGSPPGEEGTGVVDSKRRKNTRALRFLARWLIDPPSLGHPSFDEEGKHLVLRFSSIFAGVEKTYPCKSQGGGSGAFRLTNTVEGDYPWLGPPVLSAGSFYPGPAKAGAVLTSSFKEIRSSNIRRCARHRESG